MNRYREDKGAVATIVAVLAMTGVLLGALAVSVDVSNLLWERRQLQNGADASALSLAQSCAEGGDCSPNADGLPTLNSSNAFDDEHAFQATPSYPEGQCGHNLPGLPECPTTTGTFGDCPALPSGMSPAVPFVEAHVETESNTGTLPQVFAGALGLSEDNMVRACARVAFGSPGTATVPFTFSMCEWIDATADGTSYYDYEPPYGGSGNPYPPASFEHTLLLQAIAEENPCPNFNGHDVPGGFGYLDTDGECKANVTLDSWVQIKTGNTPPSACDLADFVDRIVYIPIFDCVTRSLSAPTGPPPNTPGECNYGTGNNTYYHIAGWAKFYISGYRTGGSQSDASPVSGSVPCSNPDRCISGWFLDGPLRGFDATDLAGPPASNPFGTYVIAPAG